MWALLYNIIIFGRKPNLLLSEESLQSNLVGQNMQNEKGVILYLCFFKKIAETINTNYYCVLLPSAKIGNNEKNKYKQT